MNINAACSSLASRYISDLVPLCLKHNLSCIEWDLNFLPLPSEASSLQELATYFREKNIKVRFHLPYTLISLYSDSHEKTEFSINLMSYCLSLVKEFGGKYIVAHFGSHMESIDKRIDFFKKFGLQAERHGIRLGIENTVYGPTSTPQMLREICCEANVDCVLDIGHANSLNLIDEYLVQVGSLATHIHFYSHENKNKDHLPFKNSSSALQIATEVANACEANWWTLEFDNEEFLQLTLGQLRKNGFF